MKLDTFENRSRSQTLPDYTNEPEVIATFGIELLREEMTNERSSHHSPVASTSLLQVVDAKPTKSLTLRLMGLRMASLMPVEMCPQIRQRSIEEALTQIVAMQPIKLDATQSKQTEDSTPERAKSVKTRVYTPRPKLTKISLTLPKSRKKLGKIGRPACSKLSQRKRQCTPVKNQKTVQIPRLVRAGSEPSDGSLRWCLTTTQENAAVDNRPSTSIVARMPATASTSSPEAPLSISCPVCEKQWQVQSEAEFNHHLDACLSRETIAEVVRETLIPRSEVSCNSSKIQTGFYSRKRPSLSTSAGFRINSPLTKRKPRPTIPGASAQQSRGPMDSFIQSQI
ncbi:putative rab geranylgeranyl transferase alpha subunit [Fasciola gigantica]|uniref:Putative rab geranylgeranyl transferase alpha subunit n=1 Tax=Fasciola gigantica TaxID=46835 RepID=A0A504YB54_FASGI|nr:putative rab geranylgeranyl transferase alpha subunit [Fasciola gigantica]